jgi:pimeloyl-ACP methyl ester carboxylesterase
MGMIDSFKQERGLVVSQSNQGNTMTDNGKTSLRAAQFKTIDGLKIRFATNGKTDGDPILLLSPLPESILAFLPTWEMFSALGPLVAVDLPAFGLSESQPQVRAPEPMGDFVLRIIEAFGLGKPHVVAPDVGTPACLFAAAKYVGAFKSLVIGSGATDHTDIGGILDQIVNAPSLEPFKGLTGEQFVRGAVENMKKYKLPEYALEDYLASYAGDRFWHAMAFVRDYPNSLPRLTKRLAEVTVPCQITVGRHDPFVPVSNAEGLKKRLTKSKLNVLDCGHFAWEDAAQEYGKLACDFIQGGYEKL